MAYLCTPHTDTGIWANFLQTYTINVTSDTATVSATIKHYAADSNVRNWMGENDGYTSGIEHITVKTVISVPLYSVLFSTERRAVPLLIVFARAP